MAVAPLVLLCMPLTSNRSGECAEHFSLILKQFPPQVSSRSAAAAWGCHVHNEVNKKLKKNLFDCSKIGDFYDCGCADDTKDAAKGKGKAKTKDGKRDEIPSLQLEKDG
jgi:FAD-linked sulfhydryl oxidase